MIDFESKFLRHSFEAFKIKEKRVNIRGMRLSADFESLDGVKYQFSKGSKFGFVIFGHKLYHSFMVFQFYWGIIFRSEF